MLDFNQNPFAIEFDGGIKCRRVTALKQRGGRESFQQSVDDNLFHGLRMMKVGSEVGHALVQRVTFMLSAVLSPSRTLSVRVLSPINHQGL